LIDKGDPEGAVSTFFLDIVKTPEQDLEKLRLLPSWKARVAAAHTIPREMLFEKSYNFDPERFRDLHVPTLLLLGGDSPAFFKEATKLVHQALLQSTIVLLPGQQHAAMNTAPEMFTSEVLTFLLQ
jgi:pimeloyl-ACP methyl ester carboxylesterase